MGIFHLVYFSEAADDLSYTDIKDILESSRRNNQRDEITGLLIYRDGYFIQVLEGSDKNVHATLNRIRMDDRNFKLKFCWKKRLQTDYSEAGQWPFTTETFPPTTTLTSKNFSTLLSRWIAPTFFPCSVHSGI